MLITTTLTFANKGADILQKNGIATEIRKAQGGTVAGCLFAITVKAEEQDKALHLLQKAGIRIISTKEVSG